MKRIIRYSLLALALVFGMVAGLDAFGPINPKAQNAKNRIILEDMKDRVNAVREFQRAKRRLPNEEELGALSYSLPVRYTQYNYKLFLDPSGSAEGYPKNWPASGGWVLGFWRGEWSEYYSSWDDRYTLSKELTWWDDVIPFAIVSGVLFLVSSLRFLKWKGAEPGARANAD